MCRLIWSKSKRRNVDIAKHSQINTTHTRRNTRRKREKYKREGKYGEKVEWTATTKSNVHFVWNMKLWFVFLFIDAAAAAAAVVVVRYLFQWTILFTINLVCLGSHLNYAIQFAWLFSPSIQNASIQRSFACPLSLSLSLHLYFSIGKTHFRVSYFLLFCCCIHKYRFHDFC